MSKKKKKLNWKKYWLCGIPLFITLIISCFLNSILGLIIHFLGVWFTFYLVEKYAFEDVEDE